MLRTAARLAIVAMLALIFGAARHDLRAQPKVGVVYIGAEDCAPCRTWRRNDYAKFTASAEFSQITYREISSPSLLDLLDDRYWPADMRGYRHRLDGRSGVPLWFVVVDGDVVLSAQGLQQWRDSALPTIRSLIN